MRHPPPGTGRQQPRTLVRYKAALERRRRWDALLDDAYAFTLPHHEPSLDTPQDPGADRAVRIYDSAAVNALKQRRARLHGLLFPPFGEWIEIAAEGRKAAREGKRAGLDAGEPPDDEQAAEAERAASAFHAAIEGSNFHTEIGSVLADACISTGFLMVHSGEPGDPLRFEAVPVSQAVPEEGPDGLLRTIFRRWKVKERDLPVLWPDLADGALATAQPDPEREHPLIEAFLYDYQTGRCDYELWTEGHAGTSGGSVAATSAGPRKLVERRYMHSPIIAFRLDKAPGEWMGRGPVLDALPDIRTANKVVELVLANASMAVSGLWQAEDDGVINLANLQLGPGRLIPIAPGSKGLQPLAPAADFDVSQLILEKLREDIRLAILGPALPGTEEGTRTAFEIDARLAEQQAVELPNTLRVQNELTYPLARRVLDILTAPAMAGSAYRISLPRGFGPEPVSPQIRAQDAADAGLISDIFKTRFGYETRVLSNAGKMQLLATLRRLGRELGTNDQLVLHYVGRGYTDRRTGLGYWLPSDARATTARNWVSTDSIYRTLRSMGLRQSLVLSDGGFSVNRSTRTLRVVSQRRQRTVRRETRVSVITSGFGRPVRAAAGDAHSAFTWRLASTLASIGADTPAPELFRVIRERLAARSRRPLQTAEAGR